MDTGNGEYGEIASWYKLSLMDSIRIKRHDLLDDIQTQEWGLSSHAL